MMIEQDNNGDVRRGAQPIKQSDKFHKERIKKLSAVNRESRRNEEKYEMACVVADREESLHSQSISRSDGPSKKFKLPRKQLFDDCSGVDHVSVPRKVRSAMKKRNGESSASAFPDLKKFNHSGGGAKSPKKAGVKRSKLNQRQGATNWSLQQSNGPITKDEEEVVETLYALAGMFPDSETDNRNKTGSSSLDGNAFPLTKPSHNDAHSHKLEALEEDLTAHCLSKTDEAVTLASDIERLPENTVEACSLNEPSKVMQPAEVETSVLGTKPETALGLTTSFDQLNQPLKNASWTGFASTLSSTSSHGPQPQSCAANVPAWLSTKLSSLQNDTSLGQVFKIQSDQRSQKKCASHIYISRLIKSLQRPKAKESLELLPSNLKPQEISNQGILVTSWSSTVETTKTNLNDSKSGDLQHLRILQDQSQVDLASGVDTSKKQTFDFLSLSAGGGKMECNISYNRGRNHPESIATLRNSYQAQNPMLVPFSNYQTRGTSAYSIQPSNALAQQGQLQLPPNFSSPYSGPPYGNPKDLPHQQQLWANQLAQYRNTGIPTATMHFPSSQNGRRDSPTMIPCVGPSSPTVEALGPKYPYLSHHQQLQQHQQYVGFSLQHGRLKRQDHNLSSVYEDTEVGFRAGGSALPMQLLCNEHL